MMDDRTPRVRAAHYAQQTAEIAFDEFGVDEVKAKEWIKTFIAEKVTQKGSALYAAYVGLTECKYMILRNSAGLKTQLAELKGDGE